jgi:hypothetical protein
MEVVIVAVNTSVLSLSELGNVPLTYTHEWRVAEPHEPLVLPSAIFKWYHVHREGVAIPTEMDTEARAAITEAAQGAWNMEYGLNFALIHLSTTHAFLIAGVWRGHQELWERIYYKDLAQGGPFTRIATDGEDTPAACVWEFGVIVHERLAWHRYLFSGRTEADKHAWLADTYTGQV